MWRNRKASTRKNAENQQATNNKKVPSILIAVISVVTKRFNTSTVPLYFTYSFGTVQYPSDLTFSISLAEALSVPISFIVDLRDTACPVAYAYRICWSVELSSGFCMAFEAYRAADAAAEEDELGETTLAEPRTRFGAVWFTPPAAVPALALSNAAEAAAVCAARSVARVAWHS